MQDISKAIAETARDRFGISALKPYQILVIQRILEQEQSGIVRNQIVVLPTGTGKSLCFLVPAHLCTGLTVIVYPILALMNDQMDKLKNAGIECVCIRGGQGKSERDEIFRKLHSRTKIVMTTPESLQRESVLRELQDSRISLLVIDEAHVISKWGEGFRPSYLGLQRVVRRLCPNQILAFTATASESTIMAIRKVLFTTRPLVVRGDADRPNIIYRTCPTINRIQTTIDLIRSSSRPAIVFCRTRSETEMLCTELCMDLPEINIRYYNAGLSRAEREKLENWFKCSNDGVLVATSAYGLGVDKSDVRTIIHFSLPDDIEEYLQESGRAGRDGETATAWVLVGKDSPDSPLLPIFEGSGCRREALLNQLGQKKSECTGCDVCLRQQIAEPDGKKAILKLVKLWPFRFNSMSASYLLCGSRNANTNPLRVRFNPLYESKPNWNPKRLNESIVNLCENTENSPIASVHFLERGNLLYPTGNLLYNFIASLLRRIDDGYSWIVRKTRRPKKHGKKVQRT